MSPIQEPTLRSGSALDPRTAAEDQVVLEVDGRPFSGWERFRLSRELGSCAGTFELSAPISRPWPIRNGAGVRILLGHTLAGVGNVDGIRARLSESGHDVTVSGRDATADLVDCSVHEDLGQIADASLEDVVSLAADPYSVEVDVRPSGDRFKTWRFNQGESAWTAIDRACRLRGALAFPDAKGRLVIDAPARFRGSGEIVQGSADLELRWEDQDRFQVYIVRGQSSGSDSLWGRGAAAIQAASRDFGVRRPRTLVIVAESSVDQTTAEARAAWERAVRRARSASVVAAVRGWRQTPGGELWALNQRIPVSVPLWGFRAELLVDGVEFTRDGDGTKTALRLVRPDAYSPEPVAPEADQFDLWADTPASDVVEEDL